MDTVLWVAIALIVGQGIVLLALLAVVRSFGAYTNVVLQSADIVLQTHQQNMLIQQENFNISDDLARLRAQVLEERKQGRRNQPPQSEDCVA